MVSKSAMLKKAAKAAWLSSRLNAMATRLSYALACLTTFNYFFRRKVARQAAGNGEPRVPRALRGTKDGTKEYPNWRFEDADPMDVWEVGNRSQPYALKAEDEYLIDPVVQTFRLGFSWDRGAAASASVLLFDECWRVTDTVSNVHSTSRCNSVEHLINSCAVSRNDANECITVDLSKLSQDVHHLLFVVCHADPGLPNQTDASLQIRMTNKEPKDVFTGGEMFSHALETKSGHLTIPGELSRRGPLWSFKALRMHVTGQSTDQLIQDENILRFLREIPSETPELRHVAIRVRRAKNLAAKNTVGQSGPMVTSDPYFVIQFNDETFKSNHKSQCLNPKWQSPPFDMGWITEAQMKPLTVKIFNDNSSSNPDFMGMIAIPGCTIFRLGPGLHTFWFLLGDGQNKTKEEISGHILMDVIVRQV